MPTGYTHTVQDGSTTDFADFAKICSRAFGMTIGQRDDSPDAPLITHYEPNTAFADKQLAEAREKRDLYDARTRDEWEKAMEADDASQQSSWKEITETKLTERARYEAMLNKVNAWVPPTSEHEDLKTFMVEQLNSSIKFDCDPYPQPARLTDVHEYITNAYESVNRDIDYYSESRTKEIKRTAERNAWLKAFIDSLPEGTS